MERRTILRRLLKEARPYAPQLALATLLGTGAGLVTLIPPFAFSEIFNRVLIPPHGARPDLGVLYLALGAIFVGQTLNSLLTYFQQYLNSRAGQHMIAKLRVRLFERVLNLPLADFDKWRPGELISRFSNDLQLMTDAVSISMPQLVVAVVTFVSSVASMIYLDWRLTLLLIVVAPIMSYVVSLFQRLITNSTKRTQARIADLSSNLTEVLQGQRIVKAFGREEYEVSRFRNRNDDYFGAYLKMTQFVQTQPAVIGIILSFMVVAVVWLSLREVLVHHLNTGTVIAYWTLIANLVNPMNRVAAFFGDISKAIVGSGRVFEIIDLPIERHDLPGAHPLEKVSGRIGFEHVTFSYAAGDPPALDDIDAAIEAGEIVALVGPSGAGKTTLVNLVPRFYIPQKGRVTLDGVDLADVTLSSLRGAIAIVPQDPQLFRASIAENIRYGRLDARDDEVRAAAREANADEFVSQLSEGYATEVGERGVRLSGGERQRIAIARAILRDPRILILDEATSALDSHSEVLIEQALDRLLPGRTTLIIAHRLSTIRRAHRIFYVEGGRVIETGSHDRLMASNGAYAALYARQYATGR
ncbi:MAG TPA: ABC transporter ATP-binding protein [Candidatus Baltobacteraceae bacterium]